MESFNERQQYLIKKYVKEVKSRIKGKYRKRRLSWPKVRELTKQAMSLFPFIAKEFNENIKPESYFAAYCANICVRRMNNEWYRLEGKEQYAMANRNKMRDFIKGTEIKERLIGERGFVPLDELKGLIEKENIDVSMEKLTQEFCVNVKPKFNAYAMQKTVYHQGFNDIDWADFRAFIVESSERTFPESTHRLHKILINEYYLPMADGYGDVTLHELSLRHRISSSRLSQILNGQEIKDFIIKCFGVKNGQNQEIIV